MELLHKIKLVATDLDGTFLMNDKTISLENMDALNALGEKGILSVVATGRNLQKTCEVIAGEVPFDYIVFSSGAGIYDWKNKELLYYKNIGNPTVRRLTEFLIARNFNFYLFKPVPENHNCWVYRGSEPCEEFEMYFDFHRLYSEPLPAVELIDSDACQFLVIFPENIGLFQDLNEQLQMYFPEVKIIRASSPLETGYIWMEIFHPSVSKGEGVKYICNMLDINHEYTLGIGNDFNDLDLLEFTNFSYMVENGPIELKKRFLNTRSNEENAFAHAVGNHIYF